MKKGILLFTFLAITLLLLPTTLAIQECKPWDELRDERLQVRYDFALYRAERHKIGMEAIIDYVDELGGDSSTLADLKSDFLSKLDELENAASEGDWETYDGIIEEMKSIVKNFREEARNQISEENREEARNRIQQNLDENEEHLSGLLSTAYENGKSHMRGKFDAAICVAENAIERLSKWGLDTSEIEAKLDEIKAKEDDITDKMEAAALSCADVPYGLCETDEKAEYEAAKDELVEEFRDLRDAIKDLKKQRFSQAGVQAAETGKGKGGEE